MKRKIIKSLIILATILCTLQFSYASTNTFERPSDNLGITKNIEITSSRKSIIENTPYVNASEKIYDFANLFTDDEEDKLYTNIKNYIASTKLDMIIVTINNNNKSSAQAYANDFYDYNDFGIGNSSDGILFLIDMDNRELYISTTGKAINIYELHIDSILDDCHSDISNEKYYNCANTFINSAENNFTASSNITSVRDTVSSTLTSILIVILLFSLL